MKAKVPAPHTILLQIVSNRIVWLESEKKEDGIHILGRGQVSMDPDEVDAADDQQRLQFALDAISKELHLGWFTRYDIVFLVPSHRLTARFVEIPPTDGEHIGELVEFEVSETLQVPIEQISWDLLVSSKHEETTDNHLMWVAAKKEYLDTLLSHWPQNVLFPTQITPVFGAVYEHLLDSHFDQLQEPTLLIVREGEHADLAVVTQRAVYFNRSVPLTRPNPNDPCANLLGEINRTLAYLSDRFPQGAIQGLLFVGFEDWDLTCLEQDAFQHELGASQLALEDMYPLFEWSVTGLQSEHLPLLCHAYTRHHLNQMGPNLLKEKPKKSTWKAWTPETAIPMKQFGTIASSLIAAFLLLWVGQNMWLSYAAADRAQKGQELLRLADRYKQEESGLRAMAMNDIKYADVLLFLSKTLPEKILAQSISLDQKNGIELALQGGDQNSVVEVIEKMNQSKLFRDVTLDRAANERDGFVVYLSGTLLSG